MSRGRSRRKRTKWGQNFLVNVGACRRIVDALGDLGQRAVIEVGPGRGALTTFLVERAARTLAVEIDASLAEELRASLRVERLVVACRDALTCDWGELAALALGSDLSPPVLFVGNLPYESGTAILQAWLAASAGDPRLPLAVVMLQAEVAERITAAPRTKAYGVLAVLAQATHRVSVVMDVAPGSFRPAPAIWSRVIRLERRDRPVFPPEERAWHEAFVHAAFAHRRKQLAGSLAGFRHRTRDDWRELLRLLGHAEEARVEELGVAEIVELSRRSRA